MSIIKTIFFLLIPVGLLGEQLAAQGQTINWFVGDSLILNFQSSPPTLQKVAKLESITATSAISDREGNLLFYSNGLDIMNKEHQLVQGWGPWPIDYYSAKIATYGSMFLEGHDSLFYHFHSKIESISNLVKLYLTIIQIDKDHPSGIVISKDNLLLEGLTERMGFVKQANGKDWWGICHQAETDKFYLLKVDKQGVSVKDSVFAGSINSTSPSFSNRYAGEFCFTPQGNIFATIADFGLVEVFNFDRCSGQISLIDRISRPPLGENYFYGLSFSENGRNLYLSDAWSGDTTKLRQFSLDSPPLDSSEKVIWRAPFLDPFILSEGLIQHELAPDGKIYLVHFDYNDPASQKTLGVIHNPNGLGYSCDFKPFSYSLLPGKIRAGLPNNPNYNLGPLVSQPADAGPDQTLVCYGDGVTLGVPDTTGRMAFAWSPGYGLSDSTAAQPIAHPEHSVTYTLTVTDTSLPAHCQGPDRDEVTVTVDCEPEIQNVLTLNHDGINETLRIRYLQPGSGFAVFDRWGHQLYATSNYNQDWPQQPDLLREGVYFWIVKAPELVGSPEGGKSYAGSVTVLR